MLCQFWDILLKRQSPVESRNLILIFLNFLLPAWEEIIQPFLPKIFPSFQHQTLSQCKFKLKKKKTISQMSKLFYDILCHLVLIFLCTLLLLVFEDHCYILLALSECERSKTYKRRMSCFGNSQKGVFVSCFPWLVLTLFLHWELSSAAFSKIWG